MKPNLNICDDEMFTLSLEIEGMLARYALPVPFQIYQVPETVVIDITDLKGNRLEPKSDFKKYISSRLSKVEMTIIIDNLIENLTERFGELPKRKLREE